MIEDSLTIAPADQNPAQGISLRKNFLWVFLGRAVYSASQWGILVALARLGSPVMVGRYGLALAVTAPVFAIVNLKLNALLTTDARDQYTLGSYLGLRLTSCLLALLIIMGLVFSAGYSQEVTLIVLAVGLAKAIESVSDLLFGQMQKCERMNHVGQSLMLKGSLTLLFMGLVIRLTGSLLWGILALATVWAAMLFLFDKPNTVRLLKDGQCLKPSWYFPGLGSLAWMATPLGIQASLLSLTSSIPRLLLESYHGAAALGYFTPIAYILAIGNTMSYALYLAASPRLAEYYVHNRRRAFTSFLIKLVGIGIALGGGGVLASLLLGREVLTLFFGAEYADFASVLVWIMVAGCALWTRTFMIAALTTMRLLRVQMYVSMVSVGVSLVAGWLLIPDYGIMGAAWAMLIAAWLSLFLYAAIIAHRIKRAWSL